LEAELILNRAEIACGSLLGLPAPQLPIHQKDSDQGCQVGYEHSDVFHSTLSIGGLEIEAWGKTPSKLGKKTKKWGNRLLISRTDHP
jgi:hypothetical protein